MRVEPGCGGHCAHRDAPPGESLVGWYPSRNRAFRALDAWKEADTVLPLLARVVGHVLAAWLAGWGELLVKERGTVTP